MTERANDGKISSLDFLAVACSREGVVAWHKERPRIIRDNILEVLMRSEAHLCLSARYSSPACRDLAPEDQFRARERWVLVRHYKLADPAAATVIFGSCVFHKTDLCPLSYRGGCIGKG